MVHNWEEHLRQSARDWRLYPQLTREQLNSIRCPALLITGEHDPFAGEARISALRVLVSGSKYLVVPGGSHQPHTLRESPIFVNDAILTFWHRTLYRDDRERIICDNDSVGLGWDDSG